MPHRKRIQKFQHVSISVCADVFLKRSSYITYNFGISKDSLRPCPSATKIQEFRNCFPMLLTTFSFVLEFQLFTSEEKHLFFTNVRTTSSLPGGHHTPPAALKLVIYFSTRMSYLFHTSVVVFVIV